MPRSIEELYEDHKDIPENYTRLTGEYQKISYRDNGKLNLEAAGVWADRYVREQYIREADGLIGVMDGSITQRQNDAIYDERIPEGEPRTPDAVLYLDKSARPVEWLVDALWDQLAISGAEKPDSHFLNIDRANWFVRTGSGLDEAESRLGPKDFDISMVKPEDIAAIRAYFTTGDLDPDNWKDQVWDMPTKLDGKHLLIVDEVRNQGGTLYIATELLKAAIPEATFDGSYFWHTGRIAMNPNSAERENQQMISGPGWYSKLNPMGREVGDVSVGYQNREYNRNPTQQNLRNKIAAFALSAPHHDKETDEIIEDTLAMKFKQDFAYLSYDLAAGNLFRLPSVDRDEDVFDITSAQGLSEAEARTAMQQRGKYNRDQSSR